eukprot:TRINITY_DN71483_c0_g1_i1.p1 TRINITY_DN71483_c0_g1~~TRINITY_DN71483_c0_g1_i1.p1  ORF type:complete len:503 (+),score=200.28 TRINITY_DN71483_c0_g1_i1:85-1509(+)
MAPSQSTLLVRRFAEMEPQRQLFLSFILWVCGWRAVRLARKMLRPDSASASDGGKEVRVVGSGKVFTQTSSNDGLEAGLGWRAALPYYLPALVRVLDVLDMVRGNGRGISGWDRFKREMFVIFVLLPVLDHYVAHDWSNPTEEQVRSHPQRDLKFRFPLFLWSALELVTTVLTLGQVADPKAQMPLRDRVGATVILGIFNGLGINYAHELLHKRDAPGRAAGYALLANVAYVHWAEEHLQGHHAKVGTPEDPASARKGDSLYKFLPRTVGGTLRSAWELEARRLGSTTPLWWLTPRNKVLSGFAATLAWTICIARLTGRKWKEVIGWFGLQASIAVLLLEMVNYIEHYGLSRQKGPDGKYEPVDPTHSWNAPQQLSNVLLLKLQRHSDHHAFAARPYEVLRNFKESPQLPTGYTGMLGLATVPPLFKWIMDPLVEANQEGGKAAEEGTTAAERKMKYVSMSVFAACALAARVAG